MPDFTEFTTEPVKGIVKRLWIWQQGSEGSEEFQDLDLGEIQKASRHHIRGINRR